jgi:type I restriction enzyme R subunit
LTKTIQQELADDPYAQAVFSALLKQAIAQAEAMFNHPYKQYMLFKDFEQKVSGREIDTVPDAFGSNNHAKAYYGTFRLVLGDDHFLRLEPQDGQAFVDESFAIENAVKKAVAEHSVNPQDIETEIRRALLPRLFNLIGLDHAKEVIERVIQITRVGLSRGTA